jgi:SAM-dependent methyltransferase
VFDQLQTMSTDQPQYDSTGSIYAQWKNVKNREAIENFTFFKHMLPLALDERGLLTGQRVIDLACGDGYYTRRLKAFNCAYILGVDISPTMIDIARSAEHNDFKGIQYMIADVKQLPPPDQNFDLVTGFFLLNYARTREELLEMARAIYAQLGENVAGKNALNTDKYRKYGLTRSAQVPLDNSPIPDGTEVSFSLYNDEDEMISTFISYYLSPTVFEEVFKEAGFKTFQWVPYQCDPDLPNKAFYDDFMTYPPGIGIIAIK